MTDMRVRGCLRRQLSKVKVSSFVLWLVTCGGIFLALDLYFRSNIVINVKEPLSDLPGSRSVVDEQAKAADPKLRAADLSVLKGGHLDTLITRREKNHGPRSKNPHRQQNEIQICKHPKLDLKHDANKEAFPKLEPLVCVGYSLFGLNSGILSINRTVLNRNVLESCTYRGIVRLDDSFATYTQTHVRKAEPFEILIKHDFFRVQCKVKETNTGRRRLLNQNSHGEKLPPDESYKIKKNNLQAEIDGEEKDYHVNYELGPGRVRILGEDVNNTEVDNELTRWDDDDEMTADSSEDEPDFDQFFAQVYPSPEVFERISGIKRELSEKNQPRYEAMNILIICLDSMSHLSYQRKLPLTYKYIQSELDSIILHGYNIVGDATTANLLPFLTGKSQDELPETRSDVPGSSYVDTYPFLWYKYERQGYVTLYAEDEPSIGSFNLRLNGFEHQPTDHYMRPFWQTLWSSSLNRDSIKYCTGDKPRHNFSLGYVQDFFSVYKNVSKFAFMLHAELTHWDNNPGEYIDKDMMSFLSQLKSAGHLNNTVVVLMGDHGARYSKVRWTVQGKLEERLPMMAWILPNWFKEKYPKLVRNFKQNSHKLTTPFDMHETFLDVLDLSRSLKPPKFPDKRGLSLFQEIPLNRTCRSAGVDMHWCTCLLQEPVEISNEHVQNSVAEVIRQINEQTSNHRDLCEVLTVNSVKSTMLVVPNEKVLKYRFSQDDDHRVANFSHRAKLDIAYYQVTMVTEPGGAMYEATVQANFITSTYSVNAEISRLNRYGKQAACLKNMYPSIRKFCYCKDTKDSSVS